MAQVVKKKNKKKTNRKGLICSLCVNGVDDVSYLDVYRLKKFISKKGKILSRFRSGNCSKHQRKVTKSIKIARIMSLLPFSVND